MTRKKSQYEQYERYLFSAIRKVFGWTKKGEALAAGKVGVNQYKCAQCSGIFDIKNIQVDHVMPVMPLEGWDMNWTFYIRRMFHGRTQLLCKACHKKKTAEERALRNKYKKESK